RYGRLHLATHGFFDPPLPAPPPRRGDLAAVAFAAERSGYAFARNPLLASGLVLAGANADPDTGGLCAEEGSLLDRRGCQLAVLSACQTGVGRAQEGEGVLGLQRGFQNAGARATAVSLWSVHDAATNVLMEEFYARL